MICCPETKSIYGIEKPVTILHNECRSEKRSYPLIDEVPDLRLSGNNNYATILDIARRARIIRNAPENYVKALGLTSEMLNGKKVLLAGAGDGNELGGLSKFEPELIVALDYSDHIRTLYKYRNIYHKNTTYIQGDIINLPFYDNYFDVVINSGVMQHLRSPELGFRNLFNVTKPGGILSVGTIYPPTPGNRMIERVRSKRQFHKMPAEKVLKIMKRFVKVRMICEIFRLTRIHRLFTNDMFLANHGESYMCRLGSALDYYYCDYRHLIHPREVQQWYRDLGMDPILPTNCRKYFEDGTFGSPKQYVGIKSIPSKTAQLSYQQC